MQLFFYKWPLSLPLGALLLGIFSANSQNFYWVLIPLVCLWGFQVFKKAYPWKWNQYLFFTLFYAWGYFSHVTHERQYQHQRHCLFQAQWIKIRITERLLVNHKYQRVQAEVLQMRSHDTLWHIHGNVDVYVLADSFMYLPGQVLTITKPQVKPYLSAELPGDFDVEKLKFSRNYLGLVFAKSATIFREKRPKWDWYAWRFQLKNRLNRDFKIGLSESNLALVRQLVWGDKTQIDSDLQQAFQISGTTHVLSVSGMHMALLFAMINFILDTVFVKPKHSKRKLGVLPLLWVYAFLTGMSPPVLRAVAFFIFFLIGQLVFKRTVLLVHALMAVGLIQLCLNPVQLWDIGFQLSYLAVLGLAVVYPSIKSFYENLPKWQQWPLDALGISLSSTLTTYPIILYHFHSFAPWFLVGNLLFLPLFSLLMYLLFGMVFLSGMGIPMKGLVFLLNTYLDGVSYLMKFSMKMPMPYWYAVCFDGTWLCVHGLCLVMIFVLDIPFLRKMWFLWGMLVLSHSWAYWRYQQRIHQTHHFEFHVKQVICKMQWKSKRAEVVYSGKLSDSLLQQRLVLLRNYLPIDQVTLHYVPKSKRKF